MGRLKPFTCKLSGPETRHWMNEDGLSWSTVHWGGAESTLPELDHALMQLLLENIATRVAVVDTERRYT